MTYEIEKNIDIDGIKCNIYLNCSNFPNTEIGINPWSMNLKGMLGKKLAEKIVDEHEVSFKKENFGGHSGGNPSIYREVFTVKIGKEGVGWREYLNPTKKELKDELEIAKKKLIETVRKLNLAVNKTVSEILRKLKLK